MQQKNQNYNSAFFGTSALSVGVLEELKKAGLSPKLIVTIPDRPEGRHLVTTSNVVKLWAKENNIDIFETDKLDDVAFERLAKEPWDFFVVASYGKIIPKRFIDIPKYKTLNVHPSLLPLLRGPSPIQYTILDDQHETGVTIMLIDELMDHGPILAQEFVEINEWPPYEKLEKKLAEHGGKLLAETIPEWIKGKIEPQEQDHALATYTQKITKEDGLIDLHSDPNLAWRKIQAFHGWPGAYYFAEKKDKTIRVKITEAKLEDGKLILLRVIPEGKREMNYEEFLRGL